MLRQSSAFRLRGVLGATLTSAAFLVVASAPIDSAKAVAGQAVCPSVLADLRTDQLPDQLSVVKCDLEGAVLRGRNVAVTIPGPGNGVGAFAELGDGSEDSLYIVVDETGLLTVTEPKAFVASETAAAASAAYSECVDQSYVRSGYKEYEIYNWYIGDGGMPGGLSQSAAKTSFADAIDNITNSTNNCSYSDQISAQASYRGTTTYEGDMDSSGNCTTRDGKSTWDAGNLPASTVAQTCIHSRYLPAALDDVVEADVRYNTTDFDFTNSPTSTCVDKRDIRSSGTHESGHLFGLGDVDYPHSGLTMYGLGSPCDTGKRTLGVGDVLGLRSMY